MFTAKTDSRSEPLRNDDSEAARQCRFYYEYETIDKTYRKHLFATRHIWRFLLNMTAVLDGFPFDAVHPTPSSLNNQRIALDVSSIVPWHD